MPRKPVAGIYFKNPNTEGNPFDEFHYREAYISLLDKIQNHDVDAVILRDAKTYLGKGEFSRHFRYDAHTDTFKEYGKIKLDALYDKGRMHRYDGITTLNPKEVSDIAWDKYKTYLHFPGLQPKTILADNDAELQLAIERLPGEKVIAKSVDGWGGNDIHVINRDESDYASKGIRYPVVVQEFIDSTVGESGLSKKVHDVRIFVVGDKIIGGYIREAKEGSLIANVHQGGSVRTLTNSQLPKELLAMTKKINKHLKSFGPHHFGADFMYGNGKWYMVEVNSTPGLLSSKAHGRLGQRYQDALAKYIADMAKGKLVR